MKTKKCCCICSLVAAITFCGTWYFTRRHYRKALTHYKGDAYVFSTPDGAHITLSEDNLKDIRLMHESGVHPSVIAEKYGISLLMVTRIINFINY